MDDQRIEREIVIDAPAEIVWRTITESDQIAQWFADRVELDLRPGGAGLLVFAEKGVRAPLVVEAVEPPTRFAFRWSHPDDEAPTPANSVLVEFTLVPQGPERTRLRVTETGLDELPWPAAEKARYAEDHGNGWKVCFERLERVLGAVTG